MSRIAAAWRATTDYFDNRDARVALACTVAMIVVGNQPLYPLYVWYAAGAAVPAAMLVWLSLPLYAAMPAIARRHPDAGRLALMTAAIGNTAISTVALGPASGVELFYLPCLLVAWAIDPPGRRLGPVTFAATAILACFGIGRVVPPVAALNGAQSHALAEMNAISVACLCVVVAVQAARIAWSERLSRSGS